MNPLFQNRLELLVVEDHLADLVLIQEALVGISEGADANCHAHVARSMRQALEMIAAKPAEYFSAVLLDLGLPDSIGFEGLSEITRAAHGVPVVVLTGNHDISVATAAIEVGAADYLLKNEIAPLTLYRSIRYSIERKKHEREMARLARTDPLTGLANRRVFDAAISQACAQSLKGGFYCAVILVDLDRFKAVNDSFGHPTGDALLLQVARDLTRARRAEDTLARIGGDEYGIIAPNLKTAEEALSVAQSYLDAIRPRYDLGETQVPVTASLGLTIYPLDGAEPHQVVPHADTALLTSKRKDGRALSLYNPMDDAFEDEGYSLKDALIQDLGGDSFFIEYQPLVEAGTGRIIGAEALARWRNGAGQLVPPAQFIAVAEQDSLINRITEEVMARIMRDLLHWEGLDVSVPPVSINISPVQLRETGFVRGLIREMRAAGIAPARFAVELTETAAISDLDTARAALSELRGAGVSVYLDDFGTGYSSLALLPQLPVDAIKLDMDLVRNLERGGASSAIVRAIAALSSEMGLTSVAEGVESADQATILADLGVHKLQGYHFSPPLGAEAFIALLREQLG